MVNVTVIGYGAVGRETAARLVERGDKVRVVQRKRPVDLFEGAEFISADALDSESMATACAGSEAVVCCLGFPYDSRVWQKKWPKAMANVLAGCERAKARLVFADNLYMYGPQTAPLTEDLPLTDFGRKPKLRADLTRAWQEAHAQGRVEAVAVRASDFYGPGAPNSVLSVHGIKNLLAGKAAIAPFPVIFAHDMTYVPDFARALVTLLDAPAEDYGQAWHVPNAPATTYRALIERAAALVGVEPQLRVIPEVLLQVAGLFQRQAYELIEMRFQFNRPYLVDTQKFASRFWSDATRFEDGLRATVEFYRREQ